MPREEGEYSLAGAAFPRSPSAPPASFPTRGWGETLRTSGCRVLTHAKGGGGIFPGREGFSTPPSSPTAPPRSPGFSPRRPHPGWGLSARSGEARCPPEPAGASLWSSLSIPPRIPAPASRSSNQRRRGPRHVTRRAAEGDLPLSTRQRDAGGRAAGAAAGRPGTPHSPSSPGRRALTPAPAWPRPPRPPPARLASPCPEPAAWPGAAAGWRLRDAKEPRPRAVPAAASGSSPLAAAQWTSEVMGWAEGAPARQGTGGTGGGGWTLGDCFCWLLLPAVLLLLAARPLRLAAFPTSLSDCQTPTGWNCSGYDDRENDLFLCDTNTCKFDGECLRIGDTVTCVCQFKCNSDYVPVCGSNGDTYQNECYLRQAACKQQSEILVVSEGSCATDAGSGSGDGGSEGSGETIQKETSTCDICQFGAECDEDAEDVWCVCNIDCSQTNFNPLCASDGKSYDNACQIKEASCQKQEKIEVMSLGRCQDNATTTTKTEDGHYARTDYAENANKLEENARGIYTPCPEHFSGFCMHGKCEHSANMLEPSCRCDAGYTGQHCEKKDYSVLYVVPGPVRFQYVLIAAVIGTIQIAIICVVVLCITRKCPRSNRIHRQKQNPGHYSSDNTTRASTRLI